MPINLRQYDIKPNSNYNVSITMKKGDAVIDGLRSIYVSTPKYLTTSIENASTTSTIVFDRTYGRHTEREPSVKVTSGVAAKEASTQIIKFGIKKVKSNFNMGSPFKVAKGAAGHGIYISSADVPRTLTFTMDKARSYNGSATISTTHPLLRNLNRPVVAYVSTSKGGVSTFEITLSARDIDPGITWVSGTGSENASKGYWKSETLSKLTKGIDTSKSETWLNTQKEHKATAAVPGTTTNLPGVYVDTQGLTQILKTSINNQELVSQLYWDDTDEPDAIRDVIYFFFKDDTGGAAKDWIYLDESFLAAVPLPSVNGVTAVNDKNPDPKSAKYTSRGHEFEVGDRVRITGADNSKFNGVFIIKAVTTNTFTVSNSTTDSSVKFTSGSARAFNNNNYRKADGTKLTASVPTLEQRYLDMDEPDISLSKIVYQSLSQFSTLSTPTQVRVAFTIARYKRSSVTGNWSGEWLKKNTSGLPVLSTPEILSGSS